MGMGYGMELFQSCTAGNKATGRKVGMTIVCVDYKASQLLTGQQSPPGRDPPL